MFNDMIIQRTLANNVTQVVDVPIAYEQKEKMMSRLKQDPDINNPTAVVLPRMTFFMDGYEYDASRMTSSIQTFVMTQQDSTGTFTYSPAPWNFHFSLYAYVKNSEDANKIVEQILPFFTPDFTIPAFVMPGLPQSVNLPVVLVNVSHDDTDSESFKDRSVLIWTFHFTLKGYLWGPTRTGPLISNVAIQYLAGDAPVSNLTPNLQAFGISPVLYPTPANGGTLSFTQIYNPSYNGLPANAINSTDPWVMVETTEFPDQNLPVPIGFGDLCGNGTAFALDIHTGNPASAAFNDGGGQGWGNNDDLPNYLGYQFTSPVIATSYTLYRSRNQPATGFSPATWNSNNWSPKAWIFQGSNDNTNWITLDTQINQIVALDAPASTYTFTNQTPYSYYRLLISTNNWSTDQYVNITKMTIQGDIYA